MLNAHLDTVGVAGMEAPFEPRIEDGRLYGRGAYDMKGALAAILDAAARVENLRGDVIVTAVADEELASIGTDAVLERVRTDAAIVVEPTELKLAIAHKGFVGFELETQGVAAHGSRPHLGVDAIAKMGPVLVALKRARRAATGGRAASARRPRLDPRIADRGRPGVLELPGTLPAQRREADDPRRDDRAGRGRAAPARRATPTLRLTVSREPFEVAADDAFVQLVGRIAGETDPVGVSFWADSGLIAAAGIPTVLYGPIGEGAHAEVEWVDLDSLERVRDVVLGTAVEWCG